MIKQDGTVRLCGDYKVTLNSAIEKDLYPLPRIEDLLSNLSGGVRFSKIDLVRAYQQVLVDEDTRKLLTILTHKALFTYNRLPFGIASAPAKFQKIVEKLLEGIRG